MYVRQIEIFYCYILVVHMKGERHTHEYRKGFSEHFFGSFQFFVCYTTECNLFIFEQTGKCSLPFAPSLTDLLDSKNASHIKIIIFNLIAFFFEIPFIRVICLEHLE